jgi:hypothetical protein
MKCNRNQPCSNCPFLKKQVSDASIDSLVELSKLILAEKDLSCLDGSGEIRCAGAIIHASLSKKLFKNKKLRVYQDRLGNNSDILNKDELNLLFNK